MQWNKYKIILQISYIQNPYLTLRCFWTERSSWLVLFSLEVGTNKVALTFCGKSPTTSGRKVDSKGLSIFLSVLLLSLICHVFHLKNTSRWLRTILLWLCTKLCCYGFLLSLFFFFLLAHSWFHYLIIPSKHIN